MLEITVRGVPSSNLTSSLVMQSPKPEPVGLLALSPNIVPQLNRFSTSSDLIPIPVSETVIFMWFGSEFSMLIEICPILVNFTALLHKFSRICFNRLGSVCTRSGTSSPNVVNNQRLFHLANTSTIELTSLTASFSMKSYLLTAKCSESSELQSTML